MDRVANMNEINVKRPTIINGIFNAIKDYLFPALVAILVLLTSGHARTTTRQGDFNRITLVALFIFTVFFIVLFFVKTPTKLYRSFLHPIKNKLYKNPLIYTIIVPIIALVILSFYYYRHVNSLSTIGHYLLLVTFGFCLSLTVPIKKFVNFFNKTLVVLSVIALILFITTLTIGQLPLYTSTFISVNEAQYRSFLDVYFRIDVGDPRNYGPFWEPGIFSLILIIGIVFELLVKEKPNWVNIVIFAGTLITTFSTSGLILLLCCPPLYFAKKKHRLPFYVSLVISLALVVLFIYLGDPSSKVPFFSKVFAKMFNTSSSNGSLTTRLESPQYGFKLFLISKGIGFGPNLFDTVYESIGIAQTSTFGWLVGSFGIMGLYFLVVFIIALFWYFFKKNNLRTALSVIVFTIIITNCEPMYAFSIFWILAMYPIANLIKKSYVKHGYVTTLDESVTNSSTGTRLTFTNLSGSLVVKVLALLIGLFTYPLYIKYFANMTPIVGVNNVETTYGSIALGAWLVILQILSWILTFDIGIGNGLKNKVVAALNENRRDDVRKYISCAYITNLAIIIVVLAFGVHIIESINFNTLLNISEQVVPLKTLQLAFTLAFISICLEFFFKIVLNIYQALQKETIASLIPLISTILLLVFVSFVRIEKMDEALIAISSFYIVSVNVPLVILTIILFTTTLKDCKPSLKKWSLPMAKSIITLGGLYFLIQIFLLIINSTNKVIISHTFGASVVTEYEPYLKIFSAITMVGSAISLPLWTLTVRADVNKDYIWMKRAQKMTFYLVLLFMIGAAIAACFLQLVFNLWLGDETIKVDYFKAGMFALWAIVTIISYFASAFANGLQILKPQLIVYGVGAVIKVPVFVILNKVVPNIDWISLIIIDTAIMLVAAISMIVINNIAISKRTRKLEAIKNEEQ